MNYSSPSPTSSPDVPSPLELQTVVFSLWFDSQERVERLHELALGWMQERYPDARFVPYLDMVVGHDLGGLRNVTFIARRERHE